MKKNLIVLSITALAFASCSKTEDGMSPASDGSVQKITGATNNSGVIGKVPPSFTQKVLLENFTSTTAPEGAENDLMIRDAISAWPNRIVPASFHWSDAMQGTGAYELINYVNGGTTPSMPGVMQNRLIYGGKLFNDDLTWDNYLSTSMGTMPYTGLAIQTYVNGNAIVANVHVGFNTDATGNWKVVAYVTRNSITGNGNGYDQANSANTDPGSPLYNQGDPITGYSHNFVVTHLLTPIGGNTIPTSYQYTGGHYMESYVFDVRTSTKPTDLTVVAYVLDETDHIVLNAQQAVVGTVQGWD